MYPIVIPSRGRANDVVTLERMPSALHEHVFLFVPIEELREYTEAWKDSKVTVLSKTDYHHTISEKRQIMASWIKDNTSSPWFWMMDDDLKFFQREDNGTRLHLLEDVFDYMEMFDYAESLVDVDEVCQIGISIRQGNNNMPTPYVKNTRCIRCGLFNMEAFLDVEHNRLQFMGDFDVLLQMLENGRDNIVVTSWAQDHRATNAKGGCASERTVETMTEVSQGLHDLHPGCVVIKEKENKSGGDLAKRKDVTIYWKKARKSAD